MGQCTAMSKRSKEQCQSWALRGRNTCRMHGGTSKGPKTRAGKERVRIASLKDGKYTKQVLAEHNEVMELIRCSKDRLYSIEC